MVRNRRDSGTGTGPVNVNFGTLGGTGTIAGSVTVGTGAAEVVPTDESTFSANGNPSKLAMKAAMEITLR